jgi:hypothetical protein
MRVLLRGLGLLLLVFGVLCVATWQSDSLAEKVDSGEHCGGSKGVASNRECTLDEVQDAAKTAAVPTLIGGFVLVWLFGSSRRTATITIGSQAAFTPAAWTPPRQPAADPDVQRRAQLEGLLASGALSAEEQQQVRAKLDAL